MKLYIVHFVHNDGNGYSLVNAYSSGVVSNIMKTQSAYKGVKIISIKEYPINETHLNLENTIIYEGAITSSGDIIGDSAYEIAVKNGFKGTEEEWLNSLKGVGILDIKVSESTVEGGNNIVDVILDNGETTSFSIKNGTKGDKGDTSILLDLTPMIEEVNKELKLKQDKFPDNYFIDDTGVYIEKGQNVYPISHPDLSTLPSILPLRFGNLPIKELLIPNTNYQAIEHRMIVPCDTTTSYIYTGGVASIMRLGYGKAKIVKTDVINTEGEPFVVLFFEYMRPSGVIRDTFEVSRVQQLFVDSKFCYIFETPSHPDYYKFIIDNPEELAIFYPKFNIATLSFNRTSYPLFILPTKSNNGIIEYARIYTDDTIKTVATAQEFCKQVNNYSSIIKIPDNEGEIDPSLLFSSELSALLKKVSGLIRYESEYKIIAEGSTPGIDVMLRVYKTPFRADEKIYKKSWEFVFPDNKFHTIIESSVFNNTELCPAFITQKDGVVTIDNNNDIKPEWALIRYIDNGIPSYYYLTSENYES